VTAVQQEPQVEYTGVGTKEDPFVIHGVQMPGGEKLTLTTHKQLVWAEFALITHLFGPAPPNWQVIIQSLGVNCVGNQCRVLDIRVHDEPRRLWFDEAESTLIARRELSKETTG
jgi:hypothetical protein